VWQNGYHAEHIFSNKFIMQKLDYIHFNPVKDKTVALPKDYYFSSARNYAFSFFNLHFHIFKFVLITF